LRSECIDDPLALRCDQVPWAVGAAPPDALRAQLSPPGRPTDAFPSLAATAYCKPPTANARRSATHSCVAGLSRALR